MSEPTNNPPWISLQGLSIGDENADGTAEVIVRGLRINGQASMLFGTIPLPQDLKIDLPSALVWQALRRLGFPVPK